jgi:hypothetical protein
VGQARDVEIDCIAVLQEADCQIEVGLPTGGVVVLSVLLTVMVAACALRERAHAMTQGIANLFMGIDNMDSPIVLSNCSSTGKSFLQLFVSDFFFTRSSDWKFFKSAVFRRAL